MTTLLVTTLCVFVSVTSKAQNNCKEILSLFDENVKTKRFEQAKPQLAFLRENCATLHYGIYARGETLLKHELKKASDKKTVALKLITLYEDRLKLYPEKTKKGTFLPRIGALMINHEIGTTEAQYKLFHEAFTTDKTNFKHVRHLYHYFELYYKMYKSENYGVSLENLIEKYEVVSKKFATEKTRLINIQNTSKEQKKIDRATKTISGIDQFTKNMNIIIEKEATCETLIPMYEKEFQTHKSDLQWMRKAAGKLDAKACKNDALFIELVETIDALEPSANSKLYLHKIHARKGNSAKAKTYLDAYLALETDRIKKAKILNKEGDKAAKKGQKAKARTYYLAAVKANPNSGRSYLKLAKLYATSANACGTDEFTKKAVYWKAAEMARKAASVDASAKKEATEWIARYMSLAPDKPAVFNKGFNGGEKIDMNCWIGGTVTVPKL
ncbi:hypothetical protein U8527_13380 [Kordia algicida OT-1]|nr:hypothetical protein [Kordia algicida]